MLNTIVHGDRTDKRPLLIAHGLFGSGRNWGVISKRLSNERQVIAVDMRNHGISPRNDSHTYPEMAADLAEVIDGQWDVLGHSMGGKAAMMLALHYPEKVGRLIVADIAPVAYTHEQNQNIAAMRRVDLATVENRNDAAEQLGDLDDGLRHFSFSPWT
jgi:pimeloyl-ACP methyl ester carboxylesterase